MRRGFLWAIEGRDIAIEQGLSIDIFKNKQKCFNTRLLRCAKCQMQEVYMKRRKLVLLDVAILAAYFKNLINTFQNTEVVACADLVAERAEAKAEEFGVSACSVEELLQNPEIEIVVNLTTPQAHYEVCNDVLSAGKHVYVEKPLCLTREDGKKLLQKLKKKIF